MDVAVVLWDTLVVSAAVGALVVEERVLFEQLATSAKSATAAKPCLMNPLMTQMLADAYEQCVMVDGTESEARKFLWS